MAHKVAYTANGPRDVYPAEKARQGEIILRTPVQRMIFLTGLLMPAVLLVVIGLLWLLSAL